MAAYERVLVEIAAGIGSVTLNRPEKLNAFDRAMCDELLEALRLLSGSGGVRAALLSSPFRRRAIVSCALSIASLRVTAITEWRLPSVNRFRGRSTR